MTKRAATAAKYLVPLIIAVFIGRVIYRNWQDVRDQDWTFDPWLLGLSLLLTAFWFVFRPWIWRFILQHFGYRIPYSASFLIVRQAELSRYVPGTVWQYLSRVYLASLRGVPAASCLGASLIETVLLLLASMLPALWIIGDRLPLLGERQRLLLWLVPIAAFVMIHPRVLNLWASRLARKINQPYEPLRISWLTMALIWASYLLMWMAHALAVGLFVRGVLRVPTAWIPWIAGDYIVAWLVGMISMIAPAGMGVRDGVFGLLLGDRFALGIGFTLAVAVRLWLTVVELLYALGGMWLLQRSAPAPEPGASSDTRRNTR